MNDTYKKILEESLIPLDETLDYVVKSIENNIQNKDLSLKFLQPKKAQLKYAAHQNFVDNIREKYSSFKNSYKVKTFDILEPFKHNGIIINPDESITKFIDSVDNIYLLLRDRAAKTTTAKIYSTPIFNSQIEYDRWNKEFTNNLNNMVNLAEEVGLFVSNISTKEHDSRFSNFIKNTINSKLASFGITSPESASLDFKTAAIYTAEYIKKLVYTKPRLY